MTLDFPIVDWIINNLGSSGPISARLPRLRLSHLTAPPKSSSPLTPPARSAAHHPPLHTSYSFYLCFLNAPPPPPPCALDAT